MTANPNLTADQKSLGKQGAFIDDNAGSPRLPFLEKKVATCKLERLLVQFLPPRPVVSFCSVTLSADCSAALVANRP